MTILSGAYISERDAEACGVKLAIKSRRQRNKPVATGERPVVATGANRTPVAAGPAQANRPVAAKPVATEPSKIIVPPKQPPKEPVVAAKPQPPKEPEKPVVVAKTPPKEPEKPVVAAKPPKEPEKTVVAKAQPAKEPVVAAKTQPATEPEPKSEPTPPPEKVATVTKDKAEQPATSGTLAREVYFARGSSILDNTGSLDKAVQWLTANPDVRATVEGHADPTGNPDKNMELSRARAEAARDYLVAKGIDSARLDVAPFGDTKLKYGRSDARNRRIAVQAQK
jgi:outer membrane protein OmpA-like peptidoglycan-associated protein